MTDNLLIDQTLAGDSAAFGILVTKYQNRLYHALVHVVGCPEEARDIVQDAFVQAFVKLETFQRHSAFYTWLYRIAFNYSVNHRRRRRPTQSIEARRDAAGEDPVDPRSDPTTNLEQVERAQQVRSALARLNEEYRTILVLREMDGLDYDAIAEILELPLGTVRSRLFRARMQLREELKESLQPNLPPP